MGYCKNSVQKPFETIVFNLKNNTTDVNETEYKMYNWTPIFEQVLI